MRILHIIDTLWLGGAQTVVKTLFEKQEEKENIFLFALRKTEPLLSVNHKNVFVFPSSSKYSLNPIRKLIRFIHVHEINILHCHLPRSQFFGYLLKQFFSTLTSP